MNSQQRDPQQILNNYMMATTPSFEARIRHRAPELLELLEDLFLDTPGYPGLMTIYHNSEDCENPVNCAHCLLSKRARTLLSEIKGI